jgi:hypothetical protein
VKREKDFQSSTQSGGTHTHTHTYKESTHRRARLEQLFGLGTHEWASAVAGDPLALVAPLAEQQAIPPLPVAADAVAFERSFDATAAAVAAASAEDWVGPVVAHTAAGLP